jgi:hypothetical protein
MLEITNGYVISDIEQTEDICMYALKINPRVIYDIRNPTFEMFKSAIESGIYEGLPKSNQEMLIKLQPLIDHQIVKTRIEDEHVAELANQVGKFISRNLFLKYLIEECNVVLFGGFIRWCLCYIIDNEKIPSIAETYNYLKNSDIDLHTRSNNQNLKRIYDWVIRHNGIIEFVGYSYLHKNQEDDKTEINLDQFSDGIYTIWIPSKIIGWVRYDLIVQERRHWNIEHDYTVNTTSLELNKEGKFHLYNLNLKDITSKILLPINTDTGKYLIKRLYRASKLWKLGFRPNVQAKKDFLVLFNKAKLFNEINTALHVETIEDMKNKLLKSVVNDTVITLHDLEVAREILKLMQYTKQTPVELKYCRVPKNTPSVESMPQIAEIQRFIAMQEQEKQDLEAFIEKKNTEWKKQKEEKEKDVVDQSYSVYVQDFDKYTFDEKNGYVIKNTMKNAPIYLKDYKRLVPVSKYECDILTYDIMLDTCKELLEYCQQ